MKTMSTGFEVSAYATEGNESLPRLRFVDRRRRARVSFVSNGPDLIRPGGLVAGSRRSPGQGRPEHRRHPRLDHGRQGRPPRDHRVPEERGAQLAGIGRSRGGVRDLRVPGTRREIPLPRLRDPRGRRCDGVSGLRRGVFRGRVDGIRMSRVQGLRARGRGCVSELRGALRRGNGLDECGPGNRSSARASANPGAIQAGKGRDIERAVALIADARRALDIAFVDFIGGGIERFVQEIRAAKGEAGANAVTPGLLEAVGRMEAGDYDSAWDLYQSVLTRFESEAKDFHDARRTIDEGDRLVQEVRAMGMEVQG